MLVHEFKAAFVLPNPFQGFCEAKFIAIHRAVDKLISFRCTDLDIKAIAAQEKNEKHSSPLCNRRRCA